MDFLNKIYASIKKLIPTIEMIRPDEAGVRITLGTRVKTLSPGWYFFWRLIQELEYTTVTTQVKDLRPQSIRIKSGRDLTVSGIIKYKITDVCKALLDVQDFDSSLQALALGVLHTIISTTEDIEDTPDEIADLVLTKIREEASGWGLKIQKVYISDFGHVRNIRLLTDRTGE